jgi:hypothetical protein
MQNNIFSGFGPGAKAMTIEKNPAKKGKTAASVAAASPTDNTFFRFVMLSSSHSFAKVRFDMWSV